MRSKKYNLEQKIEFASCFFCDKTILARELTTEEIIEYTKSLTDIIGDYTKLKPNKIGKKLICDSCRGDIWGLVQEEDY
jgi:hypothetical protein